MIQQIEHDTFSRTRSKIRMGNVYRLNEAKIETNFPVENGKK